MTSSFPTRLRGVPWVTVPHKLARVGSSSRTLPVSYRVSRAVPAPNACGHMPRSTFRGVSLPFATSAGGVPLLLQRRRHPMPDWFRPRRFARPRRLAPPPALRVCFAPLPRTGFTLQGVSLSRGGTGSSPALPLMAFSTTSCRHAFLQRRNDARSLCLPTGSRSARESGPRCVGG
jgi:hypothetical protein